MSQFDPTDLLCRSRREELTGDEQRRLEESIEHSLEVRLMSQILPELERESRVRPGDDLLLARINARALAALEARPASRRVPARRRRLGMLLVAAAVLLVAGLAGAWLGGVRARHVPEPAPALSTVRPMLKPKRITKLAPLAPSVPVAPVAPVAPTLAPSAPVAPIAPIAPIAPSPAPSAAVPHQPLPEQRVGPGSASELFARANLLRRQGRAAEAAVVYELLLDLYPSAREVGPTRLALGKYLQSKQPERALSQYRAVARAGGALRAEALWGISEIANVLGQPSVAEEALGTLLREFPDSPYAEVARARTLHGSR